MKTFHCDNCGMQVFFDNTVCGRCGWMLGYRPEMQEIVSFAPILALEPGGGPEYPADAGSDESRGLIRWRSVKPENAGRAWKQCVNYWRENVCNWMLDARDPHALCASCRLTRVIPALDEGNNRVLWSRLETAKRRLLHSLWTMRLPPRSKMEDGERGLAFEFLHETPHGERILTGHGDGVITINAAEADPAYREQAREQMAEPYRTLLGHFRHESGHYYFDRLVAGSSWLEPFRALFGDERQEYGQCLKAHYENGPPEKWEENFVSAYASSHPWEDWAETWAHYLHMFDTLETAYCCGVQLRPHTAGEPELTIKAAPMATASFDELASQWFALTYVLNSLNRSIGMPDSYPFTLSRPVLEKLRFVHEVVRGHAQAEVPITLQAGSGLGSPPLH